MPAFQRFEITETPRISDHEIRRRWAEFHRAAHNMSGNRLQRVLGQILGEDTVRYKVARLFGRPLLQVVRKFRGRPEKAAAAKRVIATSKVFPVNYKPRSIVPIEDLLENQDVAVVVVDETGESATQVATLNEALANASSTWLFIVDSSCDEHDRHVTLTALLHRAQDDVDVVFADEAGANPWAPLFKSPAVGPHTLLSYNLVGRPALLRTTTLRRLGGFSPDFGWAFEHDAYLRLVEAAATFLHVSLVLPAARPVDSFAASHIDADTVRVVEAALARRGLRGTVSAREVPGVVRWTLAAPVPAPSIDIIIPTRDRVELVRQCIDAIEAKTTYGNFDIIILDNDSVKPETLEYFAMTKYRVVACPGPFNYAHIVNRGVSHSAADFVVTLNNDTVLVTPDWLEQMVAMASLPDVGIVGACLLDQDGRREHESIIIAPYPQHLRTDSNYPHVDQFTSAIRDVAAVTGAVQMVRREFWQSMGGMDEKLKVTMNDVDVCLRSQLEGRHVVYTPDVALYHHVSSSRGDLDPRDDRNRFIGLWDIFGTFRDPYFPEALQLLGEKMWYLPR